MISRSARATALNSVELVWHTPPPISSRLCPPEMAGASRYPFAAVRSPVVPLKEKISPGRTVLPLIACALSWILVFRLLLFVVDVVYAEISPS